jgi:ProP effector
MAWTITKRDLRATLTFLVQKFPQTFVLEAYQPHRPLKIGIDADLLVCCPELDRHKLGATLAAYARRVMYLEGLAVGAARIDLDGNACGEVSAFEAEHAAGRLAGILALRQAKGEAAVVARQAKRIARQAAASATPAAAKVKDKPVLRLPAFRKAG